jgi:ABC-type multidrug transport system fused ATPase/permease subunit
VGFGYASGTDSSTHFRVNHVSFHLPPGQILGVIGRTGSGKSTLARLLLRLYDPQSGAIRLGGVDLRDVALADLRAHVGLVTQEVQLFQAGVRANVSFFAPANDDARLEKALRHLGLWDWVANLPNGLDTVLGGAQGLSAGEAQLLAFARVFLKNPGLVILDEAGSRLDPATEQLLERAIDGLLANRSAIIIAHRLATVQRADLIMLLDNGQVVEFGPRAALAADPTSHFARLLRSGMQEVLA